jgi:bifunctional non-homologous end joining protein LigD
MRNSAWTPSMCRTATIRTSWMISAETVGLTAKPTSSELTSKPSLWTCLRDNIRTRSGWSASTPPRSGQRASLAMSPMSCAAVAIYSFGTFRFIWKISSNATKVATTISKYRSRCAWCEPCPTPAKPPAGGIKAAYPGFIAPALATSIIKVPSGERWIHEIKFDGYRVQVHIKDAAVTVFTRRGNDWTKRFKKIADDAWHISAGSAIIDGEIVAPAADGTTDFSVLQNELKGRSTKIVMVAFDLLYLNGHDLRKLPLNERKALLKKTIANTDIQFSESFEVDGQEMLKHACKTGLEGVVSKVRDSKYTSGRINDWVKKTCAQRETLTIAGFAMKGNQFDGLYVGRREGNELIYAGKVDHGFDNDIAKDLRARLKPLVRRAQPYAKKIAHRATWVEPTLQAEVEYRAKSAEGKVRHPVFKGLRDDL